MGDDSKKSEPRIPSLTSLENTIKVIAGVLGAITILLVALNTLMIHIGPPVVDSFTADRYTINPGESANLSWKVSNAYYVTINGVGGYNGSGLTKVWPENNTIYILNAKGLLGSIPPRSLEIKIRGPVKDNSPRIKFSASPDKISLGETSNLRWNVSGATEVAIDNGIGVVPANGTRNVTLYKSTAYTLTAAYNGKTSISKVNVTVKDLPSFNPLYFFVDAWGAYWGYKDAGVRYFNGYIGAGNRYLYDKSVDKGLPDDLVSKVVCQMDKLTSENGHFEVTMKNGSPLMLKDGYILEIEKIDEINNSCIMTLCLLKDAQPIDNMTLSRSKNIINDVSSTYYYRGNIRHAGGIVARDIITIAIHFARFSHWEGEDTATVDEIWQISDEARTLDEWAA